MSSSLHISAFPMIHHIPPEQTPLAKVIESCNQCSRHKEKIGYSPRPADLQNNQPTETTLYKVDIT